MPKLKMPMLWEPDISELNTHNHYYSERFADDKGIIPIRYSFSLPSNRTELKFKDATVLSHFYQSYANTSMAQWQSYANIEFIASDIPYLVEMTMYQAGIETAYGIDKVILGTTTISIWEGHLIQADIYFDNNGFNEKIDQYAVYRHVITHEIGHGIGLMHPFEISDSRIRCGKYKSTLYSVMNHKHENYYDDSRHALTFIVPTTAMLADIAMIQELYGVNERSGLGNNIYDLSQYVSLSIKYKSIACLPWDNTGIDTLVIPDSYDVRYKKIIIDLNPYGVSDLQHGFIVLPNIKVENYIGGKDAYVDITLNKENNIIDLRKAASVIVRTTPEDSNLDPVWGNDVVYGFGNNATNILKLDIICFTDRIKISEETLPAMQIDGYSFSECSGTRIEWKNNSILFCDTKPQQLKEMVQLPFNKDLVKLKKRFTEADSIIFGLLPNELVNDFNHAITNSIFFTFTMSLTEEALLKSGCTEDQIELIKHFIVTPLLALVNGNFTASLVSSGAVSLLKYFNFSHYTCMAVGSLIYNSERLGEMLTPWGLAKFGVTSAGSLIGSSFTLFAINKGKHYIQSQQSENLETINFDLGMQ